MSPIYFHYRIQILEKEIKFQINLGDCSQKTGTLKLGFIVENSYFYVLALISFEIRLSVFLRA